VELPGADEHRDTTHKQVPFIDENAKFQLDNSMFAMISGNEIEYPTVKYYNDAENGANSQRYLQDVMNDKSMRILNSEMVDSAIKEGFTVTTTTTTTPTYPLIPQGIATSSCMSVPREHVSCGCNLSTDSSGVQAIPIGVSGVSALRVEAQVVQPPIASAPQVNLNVPVPTVPVYCPISGYRFFQNETGNVYSCPVSERFENSNGTVTTTANAVTITTQPKINTTSQPNMGQCIVKNIPLQKWVNVIVSVFNQVVDMYVDGELVSSCVLPGFPAMSSSDVKIAPRGGFSGQISRVTFYNSSMNVESAKSVYLSGPVNAASFLSNIPNWAYYVVGAILLLVIVYALM
jgi:hypothetical protein